MMKLKSIYCLAVLSAVTVLPAHAQSVRSEKQAIQRVSESVARNRLTSLKPECLMFMAEKTRTGYIVDVREKHDAQCGGDPATAPRLFSYEVDRRSGKMKTDAAAPNGEWTGEYRAIE